MGSEETKQEGEKAVSGEDLQKMQSDLSALQKQSDELKSVKEELERKLGDADLELTSKEYLEFLESKKGGKKSEAREESINFDDMTPAQIARYFEKQSKGDIEQAVKAVTERISGMDENIGKFAAQVDLNITGIKHPDLGSALDTPIKDRSPEQKELVSSILKVAEENPSWTAEKCYRQAKLEIKEENEKRTMAEKEKAEKERKSLSEKGGVSTSVVMPKTSSKDKIAEAVWQQVVGNKDSL